MEREHSSSAARLRDSFPDWFRTAESWERMHSMTTEQVMELLIRLASENVRRRGTSVGGGPYAAAILQPTHGEHFQVVSAAVNLVQFLHDPTAHASILAIRDACSVLGSHDLGAAEVGPSVLVTTCQPCGMCARAAVVAHVAEVIYAAPGRAAARAGMERVDDAVDALTRRGIVVTPLKELQLSATRIIEEWTRGCDEDGGNYNPVVQA